jgi:hypothetical protein
MAYKQGQSGMILIQTQSVTNAASVSFTTGFGSYKTLFVALTLNNLTNGASIGMGQSQTAGADYAPNFTWAVNYFAYNSATFTNINALSSAPMQICDVTNSTFPMAAFLWIRNFNVPLELQVCGDCNFVSSAVLSRYRGIIMGSGVGNVNAIQFTASSGNLTGEVSVWGVV